MPARLREIETTARPRQRRTRSRAVSDLPALVISSLQPHEYDLRPACLSLVCPSCRTWVPIHVAATSKAKTKLVVHHTNKAGTKDPRRCRGSFRLVVLDVDIERWRRRLEEGVAQTDGRRSKRVMRKPRMTVAPAVTQIVAPLLDAKAALRLYQSHCQGCVVCQRPGRSRCTDGARLAHLFAHKQRTEPARRAALTVREEQEEQREQGLWLLRELQWASTADSVRRADVQRVHDALEATLQQYGPHLGPFERADLLSTITLLATKAEQLSR
ncbi:hypothetical protein I5Q34_26745 [Streptomyces sp. AV19]|uniref:hypothetical protein n=1 Tax=Streptomyces sp. AV19 TaxID=2793068 RepID=UPI0018FF1049|nr:hypothetical protein [Streptomyces sp. AV19]MBH1937826.1 hypothetical protein [Streptomyces sp. AV19]MDG4537104.1 hypothetical protein [Streptomyces sp. AV19]